MTDKQINIVEILAEQCKNCTLYEGDTISLTISIFDRPLRGVCFDNNIYFSVDELNYIMQKLISKEQECEEFRKANNEKNELLAKLGYPTIATAKRKVFCLQEQLEAYKMEAEEGIEINAELKAENKHLNDLLNQALKELEKARETLTEIKEIANKIANYYDGDEYELMRKDAEQILQKISECEANQ